MLRTGELRKAFRTRRAGVVDAAPGTAFEVVVGGVGRVRLLTGLAGNTARDFGEVLS